MRIGLFVPCYVDQLYPDVALATLEVLESQGLEVEFPPAQTCCGQPMANTGCDDEARPLARKFLDIFQGYDYIVGPSGSCVAMVREHYHDLLPGHAGLETVAAKTYELCEFLTDVLQVDPSRRPFPYKVGLHQSCHGLRELRMGSCSERMVEAVNKPRRLLEQMAEIELVNLNRPDECCGFGGTFAVAEEAVSCMMGQDRLADHRQAGTQVLTAADMSCLMHLAGLARRNNDNFHVMHIAQILAGRTPGEAAP